MEQRYSGEEVDCIAEVGGKLVLFELKDKEFNLGHAYSFGAKLAIFQPDYPVILTTEKIGKDALDHFALTKSSATERRALRGFRNADSPPEIIFIEGLSSLPEALENLYSEIVTLRLAPVLHEALTLTNANSASILRSWAGIGREGKGVQ